jgi:hypothetical protein
LSNQKKEKGFESFFHHLSQSEKSMSVARIFDKTDWFCVLSLLTIEILSYLEQFDQSKLLCGDKKSQERHF